MVCRADLRRQGACTTYRDPRVLVHKTALSRALHMARHRLPYAVEQPFEGAAAKVLVTGRHRRATCPMQCRAKLIGGREKRPRDLSIPDLPFEKVLATASRLCGGARVSTVDSEVFTFGVDLGRSRSR